MPMSRERFLDLWKSHNRLNNIAGPERFESFHSELLNYLVEHRIDTIDVAYQYLNTPTKRIIIADVPGHEQYTRNMATGASTCDLAIILIDARHGILAQTKRHTHILGLLNVPHLIVAVNKMDLVDYSEERFEEVMQDLEDFSSKLGVKDVRFIPLSALYGDNVVDKSKNMAWYEGPTLLYTLENVHISSDHNMVDCRFPVQYVVRPQKTEFHDYRGYAGRVAGGVFKKGDEVLIKIDWKKRYELMKLHSAQHLVADFFEKCVRSYKLFDKCIVRQVLQ